MNSAEALYDEALRRDPLEVLRQFRELSPETLRGLPQVPKPLFLEAGLKPRLVERTLAMAAALKRLTQEALAGQRRDYVPLDQDHSELVGLDGDRVDPQCFWRFDLAYIPETDQMRYLECNAGDPSGMGFTDQLAAVYQDLSPMQAVKARYRVDWSPLMDSHQRTVRERFQSEPEGPAVTFVCPPESTVYQDHLAMVSAYQKGGWKAQIRDPREFEYRDGTLYSGSEPIHQLVRDTTDELILEPYREKARAILEAYRAGAVRMVNPLSSNVADHKSLFSLLTQVDPSLESVVPETRLVREAADVGDLDRRDWVLKPSFGWGGLEVTIGLESDQERWDLALETALAKPGQFILQRYYPLPEVSFPVYHQGEFHGYAPRHLTLSCWIHNGRFAGAFARAGAKRVVNVNQGGSLMPVFFVEEKA